MFDEKLQAGGVADLNRVGRGGKNHKLRGLVCYTSMHYVAFFWNPREDSWTYCDDSSVKEVSSRCCSACRVGFGFMRCDVL